METLLINIVFLLLLVILFMIYKYLTRKKLTTQIPILKSESDEYEKVLYRLVHDTKNHIATTSLALHNLEFVINENKNTKSENPVDEYLSAAKTALNDTTHKVQEAIIFTRTGTDKFMATDIQILVNNLILGLNKSETIIPRFDDELPLANIDQQAIEFAIGKLFEIALEHSQGNTVVHISLSLDASESAKPKILCMIYSQGLLDYAPNASTGEFLNFSSMPESDKICYMIAQKIIKRHSGKIIGAYNPTQGVLFSFNLYAAGDQN